MANRPTQGKRYPKGRLNQMASAYFSQGAGMPTITGSGNGIAEGVIEGANSGTGEGYGLTRPNISTEPPTVSKPGFLQSIGQGFKNIGSMGGWAAKTGVANQLANAQYEFQLKQHLQNGDFESARALAEQQGVIKLAQSQQDQTDKLDFQNIQTSDTLNINDRKALADRGYPGISGMELFSGMGGGQDAVMASDKLKFLTDRIKADTLITPEGEQEQRGSFIEMLKEQGIKNRLGNANAFDTETQAAVRPFMSVGGNSLVNVLKPQNSYSDMGSRKEPIYQIDAEGKPLLMNGRPIPTGEFKETVPQVVGVNALEGTRLVVKPKSIFGTETRPTITGNSTNDVGLTRGFSPNAVTPNAVIPSQTLPNNLDTATFEELLKRLRIKSSSYPITR